MKLTTSGIIQNLPFDDAFKKELSSFYLNADADGKYRFEQLIWDAYYVYYQILLDENIELALQGAEKNTTQLNSEFYKKVREKTEKQLTEESYKSQSGTELNDLRLKLEKYIVPAK